MIHERCGLLVDPGNVELGKLVSLHLDFKISADCPLSELWSEESAGFKGSRLFGSLTTEQKHRALGYLSTKRIQLALAIEEMGLVYCAKMNLMSKSREERIAYALMGADEARHFEMLQPFLDGSPQVERSSLRELVGHAVEATSASERLGSLFCLQVLLEGFGLSYYRGLAQMTSSPALKDAFTRIVSDESFHHALGIVLFDQEVHQQTHELDPHAISLCEQLLRRIAGELWIADALEHAADSSLSNADRESLIVETGWRTSSQQRLDAMTSLVKRHAPKTWIQELERRRAFTA